MARGTKIVAWLTGVMFALLLVFSTIAFLVWRTRVGELAECQAWRLVTESGGAMNHVPDVGKMASTPTA